MRRAALVVALAFLPASCGSTAQTVAGGGPVGTQPGDVGDLGSGMAMEPASGTGLSPGGADATDGGLLAGGGPEAAAAGASGLPGSPGGTGPGASGPAGVSSGPPGRRTGPSAGLRPAAAGARGITDKELRVGLSYVEDSAEANAAAGAAGVTTGDERAVYETLLAYVNDRGGVAGRKLVPVYHRFEAISSQTDSAQDQAACARFTQDEPVFAALTKGISSVGTDSFLKCMDDAGIPVIDSNRADDDNTFGAFRRYVTVVGLSLDTVARIWPGGLAEGKYFDVTGPGKAKVGLVSYDLPQFHRSVQRSLRPAMSAVGQSFADEVYVRAPDSYSEISQTSAELGNAILRFRSQGIEHVMIHDGPNASLAFLFMTAADGQEYRPRYGLTSYNGGQVMAELVPEGQMDDAVAVGWKPQFDVPARAFKAWGPGRAECEQIFRKAGTTFSDVNAESHAMLQCDHFRVFVQAVERSSGPLGGDSVIHGVARLGSSFDSAQVVTTQFGPRRRYGVARYRLLAFFADCRCFKFTSGWRRMP